MPNDGLQKMLDFLRNLQNKGIHYQIDQASPDALLAFFTIVGGRVEVEFRPDGMRYRTFIGNEDVLDDLKFLTELINSPSG
jgi:hypothetical protein